jgi:hypothetical protein
MVARISLRMREAAAASDQSRSPLSARRYWRESSCRTCPTVGCELGFDSTGWRSTTARICTIAPCFRTFKLPKRAQSVSLRGARRGGPGCSAGGGQGSEKKARLLWGFRPLQPCLARSKGAKSALGSSYPGNPGLGHATVWTPGEVILLQAAARPRSSGTMAVTFTHADRLSPSPAVSARARNVERSANPAERPDGRAADALLVLERVITIQRGRFEVSSSHDEAERRPV